MCAMVSNTEECWSKDLLATELAKAEQKWKEAYERNVFYELIIASYLAAWDTRDREWVEEIRKFLERSCFPTHTARGKFPQHGLQRLWWMLDERPPRLGHRVEAFRFEYAATLQEIPNQANGRAARFERVRTQLEAEGWRGQYLEKLINVIKRTVQNKDDEAMFHMHSYLRGRGFCVENTKERDLELALFCRGVDLPYSDF